MAPYPEAETAVEHVGNALQLARALRLDLREPPDLDEARATLRALENRLAAAIEKLEPARIQ